MTRKGLKGAEQPALDESKRSLAATSLAHFINDGLNGVFPLMYPVYVSSYQLSTLSISILAFLQNAFSMVVSPWVGKRSDVSGDFAKVMSIGIASIAIGAAGYAFSVYFSDGLGLLALLLLFTIFVGVGSSIYHPLGATILRSKWKAEDMGRAMGFNGSAGSIGRVLLPLAAAFLISSFALTSVGLIGVLCLVGAFVILGLLREIRFSAHATDGPDGSRRPGTKLTRRLLPLTTVSFSRGLFTGVQPFFPLYLIQVDHFGVLLAGILYSVSLGMGIASQLIFGYMYDHAGPKLSLGVSNVGGVVALFAFALTTNQILAVVTLFLFGLFSYSAFPLILGLVHTLTDFHETTTASSIVWGVGNTGGAAACPLLVGALALPMLYGTLVPGFIASAAVGLISIILMPWI